MPKDWNGSVFPRKSGRLVLRVKGADGWQHQPTPFRVGQEEQAEKLLRRVVKDAKAASAYASETGQITVKSFAKKWLEGRSRFTSWKDDQSHLEQHVYPAIGGMPIDEVRPKHLRDMVRQLEKKTINRKVHGDKGKLVKSDKKLSAKTIRNVYGTCVSLFRDAAIEGQIEQTPAILTSEHLPADADTEDDWRDDAIFTAGEIETLISDVRIPFDRRVFYAVAFLGCTRFGEGAALRWRRYDAAREPLGALVVRRSYNTRLKVEKSTKTKRPRTVPVHPVLASMLAQWKLTGFPALFGRKPEPDDLLVPSRGQGDRPPGNRSSSHMLKKFHRDCEAVGIRVRRQHDSRMTWISLARSAGANDLHRRWISHGPTGSVDDGYTSLHWPELCAVVSAIKVGVLEGKVISMEARR
jgi:integrase